MKAVKACPMPDGVKLPGKWLVVLMSLLRYIQDFDRLVWSGLAVRKYYTICCTLCYIRHRNNSALCNPAEMASFPFTQSNWLYKYLY